MPPKDSIDFSNFMIMKEEGAVKAIAERFRGIFSAFNLPLEMVNKLSQTLGEWHYAISTGASAELVEPAALSRIAELREADYPSEAVDCLAVAMLATLADRIDHDHEFVWWASIQDANFMVWELFDAMGGRFKEVPRSEYFDHPYAQGVLELVRQTAPPERIAEVLRAYRLRRLLYQHVPDHANQPLPEDQELAAMGVLSGDELEDWCRYSIQVYPNAPWKTLADIIKRDDLWAPTSPIQQRQHVVTNFGGSYAALLKPQTQRKDLEHLKAKLIECEEWRPSYAVWDELRFIYVGGLYQAGYPDRARLVVCDMKDPGIMLEVVKNLLEQGQADEAWKLVKVLPHTQPITRALLSDLWPDAPLKRKKLDDILARIDRKNMNRYPPWLREGCREDMIAIYEESGDLQAAARMRESLELLQRQKGNYFNYRGDGSWK